MQVNYISLPNSAMADSLIFPNIHWTIEKACSISKKRSPTFEFLSQRWKLTFLNSDNGDGGIFQFFLHRMTPLANKHGVRLRASSYIVQADGRLCMEETKELDLNLDEWCLMFWEKSAIRRCVGSISEVRFFCSIRLFQECESVLDENEKMNLNPPSYSPCSYIMCQDFASMVNKNFLSDVTLVCGDQTIYAHRAILSARSKWFAKSFSQLEESEEQSLKIDGVEPTILKQLIRYMYSGEISELSVANIRKIYLAANNYEVESLKNKCMLMIENLSLNVPAGAEVVAAEGEVAGAKDVVSEKSYNNAENDATSYFSDIQAVLCSVEWKNLSKKHPEMTQKAFQYFVFSSPCENPESV